MPLPEPEARDWLQIRNVECRGYRRRDGMWDIEGHLVDLRTYTYPSRERGDRAAGQPVHDIWLRLTLDDNLEVRDVACAMDSTPMAICCEIEAAYRGLIGLRVASGWNKKVRELFGGGKGCTHLQDMLVAITGTAIQTIGGYRDTQRGAVVFDGTTPIASCHAMVRQEKEKAEHGKA
ncbi:MAG: DUF2889 domain-containing protein [Rhodocyclaceae bacterium]|jgi:hypothetical protein|nr:DUF2889 domain-containing protein [Rhodocyclaceae bacterium]